MERIDAGADPHRITHEDELDDMSDWASAGADPHPFVERWTYDGICRDCDKTEAEHGAASAGADPEGHEARSVPPSEPPDPKNRVRHRLHEGLVASGVSESIAQRVSGYAPTGELPAIASKCEDCGFTSPHAVARCGVPTADSRWESGSAPEPQYAAEAVDDGKGWVIPVEESGRWYISRTRAQGGPSLDVPTLRAALNASGYTLWDNDAGYVISDSDIAEVVEAAARLGSEK